MKCLRCGWPCKAVLFTTAEDCTNTDCPFFGGREVMDMMAAAEKLLKEAGLA